MCIFSSVYTLLPSENLSLLCVLLVPPSAEVNCLHVDSVSRSHWCFHMYTYTHFFFWISTDASAPLEDYKHWLRKTSALCDISSTFSTFVWGLSGALLITSRHCGLFCVSTTSCLSQCGQVLIFTLYSMNGLKPWFYLCLNSGFVFDLICIWD